MKNKFFTYIVPVILLLGGILFVALGVINLNQVKNYPQVDAVVTHLEQETEVGADNGDINETITVLYIVDGKEYQEVLQFHEVGKYQVGDTVTVRYDPENPNYVTAGNTKTSVIYIALGAVFALGGLAMLIKFLRN